MLGKDRLQEIAGRVLGMSHAEQTEVLVMGREEYLTRFAGNVIHQNVSEANATVRVRVITGGKVGVASGNDLSDEGLQGVVSAAEMVARFQHENAELSPLPEPRPLRQVDAYVSATAMCTPEQRAKGAATICSLARAKGLVAAGVFSTAVDELAVVNSKGVAAYHCGTVAHVMAVVMGDGGTGYAASTSMDVDEIDPEEIGQVAVDKALRSRNPETIAPGLYTVILEEEAVADMISTLGYLGFGALAVQEGRSFMNGRFGEQIVGRNITIWDDGLDRRGLPMPFDFEGVPKRKVMLIEEGVAKDVVYDTFTASREPGRESTGHSLPAPNTFGPMPWNLFVAPGKATKEDMLTSTKHGIWVTRFHYTNPVHRVKTVLTGMTRDGTFLIEGGRIVRPIKNLRFTQSILEALGRVEMIGSTLKAVRTGWRGQVTCAPALKISGFNFSGVTEF